MLGDGGRLAAVLVLQLALVVAWVLVTGIEGFVGSLVVGAGRGGAADLVIVLPARPAWAACSVSAWASSPACCSRCPPSAPDWSSPSPAGSCCSARCRRARPAPRRAGRSGPARSAPLLAVGAALVAGHLADLVLPRPSWPTACPGAGRAGARGAGRGGLSRSSAAARAVATGAADPGRAHLRRGARRRGGLVCLVASYLVVEARAERRTAGSPAGWALPLIQGVLPLAACASGGARPAERAVT